MFASINPAIQGMVLAAMAGFTFALLNTVMRKLSLEMSSAQALFLRYGFGLVVMLPIILQQGMGGYKTNALRLQLSRGLIHTVGLMVWISALPQLPLPYTTALGFTQPIFIMLGAALFLGETMRGPRWIATCLGFLGVIIIVGPRMQGTGTDLHYSLVMLSSAPLFAGSFLLAKVLTRHDAPTVIVCWQALTVTLFTLPLAALDWQAPTTAQWFWFLLSGCLGSLGHWFLTRAYAVADISTAQPVKFLDLVWTSMLGYLVFSDVPSPTTFAGGAVIVAATFWIARHERRQKQE
jgi:drug/metabolite transporter (DMT)-like permease